MPRSLLTELLHLTSVPVAVSFVDTAPPGVPHVSAVEEQLAVIVRVNQTLEKFHRGRAATPTTIGSRTAGSRTAGSRTARRCSLTDGCPRVQNQPSKPGHRRGLL